MSFANMLYHCRGVCCSFFQFYVKVNQIIPCQSTSGLKLFLGVSTDSRYGVHCAARLSFTRRKAVSRWGANERLGLQRTALSPSCQIISPLHGSSNKVPKYGVVDQGRVKLTTISRISQVCHSPARRVKVNTGIPSYHCQGLHVTTNNN